MEHDAILDLNGKEIMRGDSDSVHVIFNNISGRNFVERQEWETPAGTYGDYLAYMAKQLHVGHWAGKLTVRVDGVPVREFHFPVSAQIQPQAAIAPAGGID